MCSGVAMHVVTPFPNSLMYESVTWSSPWQGMAGVIERKKFQVRPRGNRTQASQLAGQRLFSTKLLTGLDNLSHFNGSYIITNRHYISLNVVNSNQITLMCLNRSSLRSLSYTAVRCRIVIITPLMITVKISLINNFKKNIFL